jgi:hypothetical protein
MRCKGQPFCGVIYTIKEQCFLPGVVPQCAILDVLVKCGDGNSIASHSCLPRTLLSSVLVRFTAHILHLQPCKVDSRSTEAHHIRLLRSWSNMIEDVVMAMISTSRAATHISRLSSSLESLHLCANSILLIGKFPLCFPSFCSHPSSS